MFSEQGIYVLVVNSLRRLGSLVPVVTLLTSDLPLSVFLHNAFFSVGNIITISNLKSFRVEIWPKKKCTELKSKIELSK